MKLLKSRRVWAITIMFLIGGVEAIALYVPDMIETPILALLGFFAVYFSFNPSQEY